MIYILFFIPGSSRWNGGNFLLITKQQNDTIVYALHGKNIKTYMFGSYYYLNDSVSIHENTILEEYNSEVDFRKGYDMNDAEDKYWEYHNKLCECSKKSNYKVIYLDDNVSKLTKDCTYIYEIEY